MGSVLWRENTSFVFSTDWLSKGDLAPRIWGCRPEQQEDGRQQDCRQAPSERGGEVWLLALGPHSGT